MNLVIMGAQWGDEGKGKIVDFLAAESDIVLRYSGGANAGHTVVIGEETYKLHLIPSGITHADKRVVLGSGMVIDLESLFSELDGLSGQGINYPPASQRVDATFKKAPAVADRLSRVAEPRLPLADEEE